MGHLSSCPGEKGGKNPVGIPGLRFLASTRSHRPCLSETPLTLENSVQQNLGKTRFPTMAGIKIPKCTGHQKFICHCIVKSELWTTRYSKKRFSKDAATQCSSCFFREKDWPLVNIFISCFKRPNDILWNGVRGGLFYSPRLTEVKSWQFKVYF